MMKKYKWQIIISIVLILLPAVFLLCFAEHLPAQMAIHWGVDGTVDGFGTPLQTALFIPVMALLQCLFLWLHFRDKRNREQSERATAIVFWIMPLIEYFVIGVLFMTATGREMNISFVMCLLFAVLFLLMGNYMPKVRQNSTMGIKVVWTYSSEENWNATHRLAGKVWVIGGVLVLFAGFLPDFWGMLAMFLVLIPMVAIPTVYSYCFYKKEMAEGKITRETISQGRYSNYGKSRALIGIVVVAVFLGIVLFTGQVQVEYGQDAFTVKGTMWKSLTVEYDAVEEVEFREEFGRGSRVQGVGTTKLMVGMFRNEEFGIYNLYSYTQCKAAVIVYVDGRVLAISGEDEAVTRQIYQQLLEKVQEG